MDTMGTSLWLLTIILATTISDAQNLFVAAPNTIRVGANETVAIFSHHDTQDVMVYLTDFPGKKKQFSGSNVLVHQNEPVVVNVMVNPGDIPDLGLSGSGEKHYVLLVAKAVGFLKEIKILVSPFSGYVFLQTDKPIYTPKQDVKIRILCLDEDMAPNNQTFKLQIRNPQNIIMENMPSTSKALKTYNGIYNYIFNFPKHPTKGIWSVVVFYGLKVPKNSTVFFEVDEYILPTFELKIEAPKVVLPGDESIGVSVEATYVYGKKVDGFASFRFGFQAEGLNNVINFGSLDNIELRNGFAEKSFSVDEIRKNPKVGWFPQVRGGRLVVEATVRERSSGDTETKTESSTVFATSPYHITFKRCLMDYKPGLATTVEADVEYMDGKPAANVAAMIKVVDHTGKTVGVKFPTAISTATGALLFIVKTQREHTHLRITVRTEQRDLKHHEQAVGEHSMVAYSSKTSAFVALQRSNPGPLKVYSRQSWTVYSYPKQLPLSYLITSQGRIVDKGSLLNVNEPERTIGFIVKPEMVPSIRIVLFAHNGKEFLTDSIKLDVEKTCSPRGNISLEVDFGKEVPAPGDEGKIVVRGTPNTAVGILAVDKAVYALRDKDLLTKDKMYREMESHDLGCGPGGGRNSHMVLEHAGLLLLSDHGTSATERPAYTCTEKIRRKRAILDQIQKEHGQLSPMCCELGKRTDKLRRPCEERAIIISLYKGAGLEDPDKCAETFYKCCVEATPSTHIGINQKVTQMVKPLISSGRFGSGGGEELGFLKDDQLDASIENVRERSDFRETWLFQIEVIGADGSATIPSNLPHSITTWVVQAVSVSPKAIGGGMCVADPMTVKTFKDVFMQVKMPYSVVRNEQIEIPVTIFNYSPKKQPIMVYFIGVKHLCSEAQPDDKSTAKRIWIEANSFASTGFGMVPLEAKVYPIKFVATSPHYHDIVTKDLNVIAEGVSREEDIVFTIDPSNSQKRKRRSIEGEKLSVKYDEEMKQQLSIVKLVPELEYVPGTESCYITAIGDKFGTTIHTSLENPERLLRMPQGCGEQTMAFMAPSLYTLHYLKVTGQLTGRQETNGYHFVREGYKRELSFRKPDGSFAAWTNRPSSTWLTAFVAKVFCQAEKHIFIDDHVICSALTWLTENQQPDGSFLEKYAIIHKEMMGGVVGRVPLTAFVLLAFGKCSCNNINTTEAQEKATDYLLMNVPLLVDPYQIAIATYALAVVNPELAEEPNRRLIHMSRFDEGLNRMYFGDGNSGKSIEMASYALQTQLIFGHMDLATSIVNWMNTQRTVGGAFWSTQDTVAAIDALSGYAIKVRDPNVSLICNLTSTNDPTFRETLELSPANARILQVIELSKLGGKVFVESQGSGVGTMGIKLRYNTPGKPEKLCKFELSVNISEVSEIKIEVKAAEEDELMGFFPRDLMLQLEVEKAQKKATEAANKFKDLRLGNMKADDFAGLGRIANAAPPPFNPADFRIPHLRPLLPRFKRRGIVVNPKPQDHTDDARSTMNSKYTLNVTICTKYLENRYSNMAVIEAGIFTGFRADTKDLKALVNSSMNIARFEESGRNVVFYLDEISNEKPTCFWFRIFREFVASNLESSLVRVYDYYEPEQGCSQFYRSDRKSAVIRTVCEGEVCICAEGGCPAKEPFSKIMTKKSSSEQRKMLQEIACEEHDFFWKVRVDEKTLQPSGFWIYRFAIISVLKEGLERERDLVDGFREFKARVTCEDTANLSEGSTYLILGRDQEPIEENGIKKYIYYMDKTTRIHEWTKPQKGQSATKRNLQKHFQSIEKLFMSKRGCPD